MPVVIHFLLSQVNFMITDTTVTNRRRRRDTTHKRQRAISESDAQLYRDLAQASGGQAIEVTKSELPVATSIITETSRSSMVTKHKDVYQRYQHIKDISCVTCVM